MDNEEPITLSQAIDIVFDDDPYQSIVRESMDSIMGQRRELYEL